MPLYACDRCGFTSTAFRVDAARLHRLEYPQCEGSIRIIFRSDDRYRARKQRFEPATSRTAAPRPQEEQSPSTPRERSFEIRERLETSGTLCLTVLGELDTAVTEKLSTRLRELKTIGRPVRLDLSQLGFIDSSGVQALLVALADARWDGWQLEVARQVSPSVERAAQIVGISQVLWPESEGPERAPSAEDQSAKPS